MLEKNYTNPEDKGRFGFSESGTYNAPVKGEHIIVSLLIAGIIILSVLLFVLIRSLAAANTEGGGGIIVTVSVAGGVGFLILEALLLTLGITLIKTVKSGYKCKYDATEDKFVVNIGGTLHTIYYREVQAVHFQPRHWLWFRNVQGYDVTVKINGAEEVFSVTSDGYISPKSTPFYIIKERIEMIEQAENDESHRRQQDASAVTTAALTPKTRKSPRERLEALMEQEEIMPSVGAASAEGSAPKTLTEAAPEPKISLAKTSAAVEPMQEEPLSPYDTRVSPTVLGYGADMPTVTKQTDTYIGEDGRLADRDAIISRGTFCVAYDKKTTAVFLVIAAVLALIALRFIIGYFIFTNKLQPGNFLGSFLFGGYLFYIGAALFSAAAVVVMRYLMKGIECRYKADGREFAVYRKKRPDENILYTEVLSVDFKPRKFMWFDHGYDVEIATKSGFIRFRYVFPRLRHVEKIRETPFHVIRRMSGDRVSQDEY